MPLSEMVKRCRSASASNPIRVRGGSLTCLSIIQFRNREAFPTRARAIKEAPFSGKWAKAPGFVRHSFTHFHLEIEVYVARFSRRPNFDGVWVTREKLGHTALPTAMKKLIHHALEGKKTRKR